MSSFKKFEDNILDDAIQQWLLWDQHKPTRNEIAELVKSRSKKILVQKLLQRMSFGTAGLRARMGAGNSEMNDLTIIQTTQGFCQYMLLATKKVKENGVMIGYDARHNSKRFAQRIAKVFQLNSIKVYSVSDVCPTPFVPYAVLKYGCDWGIMVTASHNPKDDNGYKVYYANGAQIISPHDKNISKHILDNLEPSKGAWSLELDYSDLYVDVYNDVLKSYVLDLQELCHFKSDNNKTDIKFTYTAMHGVGYKTILKAFEIFNIQEPIPVIEQIHPDPEFPTVTFPNPEEGKSALKLAMQTADKHNSTVILANDPDADRLALAEKLPNCSWHVFSGNEIGALLGYWNWELCKKRNISGENVYAIASTVSSQIMGSMAAREGFKFVETLTGFKWMGNKADELRKQGKTVIFAFEEAIGFMCGEKVLDKDGISAAVVLAEMVIQLNKQGITCKQQLEILYEKYGQHVSKNSYFICHDSETITNIFERLRNYKGTGRYPKFCGKFEIKHVRDLTVGYDDSQPDYKPLLPVSKSSQMITFTFENGCSATIRTSGTEPKIKYYTEYCAKPGRLRKSVEEELDEIIKAIIENFYEPEKNKLIAKSE